MSNGNEGKVIKSTDESKLFQQQCLSHGFPAGKSHNCSKGNK